VIITKRFKTNFTEEELKKALFSNKGKAEEILNDAISGKNLRLKKLSD
jgi:hypothetical protein